jgi:hypothetical protein
MTDDIDWPALLDAIEAEIDRAIAEDNIDDLRGIHDGLSNQLGKAETGIHALEEDRGNPEGRELRREYYRSVL